jgi:hypothetical protein
LKASHERGALAVGALIFKIRQALIVFGGARLVAMCLAPRGILSGGLGLLALLGLSGASG